MESLKEIILRYGTDKTLNGYTDKYEEVFTPFRFDKMNILEVGIANEQSMYIKNYQPAASLKTWRDYFINSMIYGVDINPNTKIKDERIECFIFDSTDSTKVSEFLIDLKFKIIIDDGSHDMFDQIKTFDNLYPKLEKGGLYIIEDILNANLFFELKKRIDLSKTWRNRYSNLLIIKKY